MVVARWEALAALVDSVRRALYDYVRHQDHAVTREEAADATRISRNLAAFHLDKLVSAGLLRADYGTTPTEEPRGRGRSPKVYRAVDGGVSLSIPERHYDLIGQILADAVAGEPADARTAALRVAGERGSAIGRQVPADAPGVAGVPADAPGVAGVLADLGFEPISGPAGITLGNCPFHDLAQHQTELVCSINQAFLAGVLTGLGRTDLEAELAPGRGACCVLVRGPAD